MAGINKVILIGRLGSDPEIRTFSNGGTVADMSIATSEEWKDKAGEKKERTEWHRVAAFGRLGEICGEYLHKGSQVYFEGRLETRKWQDADGNDRYTTQIIANRVEFLGGGRKNGNASADSSADADSSDHYGDDDVSEIPF